MTEYDLDDDLEEPTPEVSHHSERDAALAAVLRHEAEIAEKEEAYREKVERRQGFGARHIALAVSTILTLWVWVFPPGVIRIEPTPLPPLQEEEAALRLVMYFQAQKIEQFLLDNGRIPDELEEAGPTFPGMEYIRLTDRHYRILGRTDRMSISFLSTEEARNFLGDGAEVLDLGAL